MATPTTNTTPVTYYSPADYGVVGGLLAGSKWGDAVGSGVTLTYSFPTSGAANLWVNNYGFGEVDTFRAFNTRQQDATRDALALWAAVADITFVEVTDSPTEVGEMRFGFSDEVEISGSYAYAYLPDDFFVEAGDSWYNSSWGAGPNSLQRGRYDFTTLIHEIGHALGLEHPFEGAPTLPEQYDNYFYTIMSYSAYARDVGNYASYYPTTPMYYDILALQAMYGAAQNNVGDTVYTFDGTQRYFETIYDTGGNDRIVYNGVAPSTIDLREKRFSNVGADIQFDFGLSSDDTVCIGPGTVIEQAFGGTGADTLIGNFAANVLNGRGGADSMTGGVGNDLYYVNVAGDQVIENAGGGLDTVNAAINYTLGANVENLILSGAAATGTGNALANTITGNAQNNTLSGLGGADILNGGAGADSMNGGAGNDTYIVDNIDDTLIDSAGLDAAQSSVSFTLALGIELLTLTGVAAINGKGNAGLNILRGNDAANTLNGAGGNDTLHGGLGNDVLVGGSGADRFVFDTAPDGAANRDLIFDFNVIDDTILLDDAIFTMLGAPGALNADFFLVGAAALDADDFILLDDRALYYDADGSGGGAAVQFAAFGGAVAPALTSADFLIV